MGNTNAAESNQQEKQRKQENVFVAMDAGAEIVDEEECEKTREQQERHQARDRAVIANKNSQKALAEASLQKGARELRRSLPRELDDSMVPESREKKDRDGNNDSDDSCASSSSGSVVISKKKTSASADDEDDADEEDEDLNFKRTDKDWSVLEDGEIDQKRKEQKRENSEAAALAAKAMEHKVKISVSVSPISVSDEYSYLPDNTNNNEGEEEMNLPHDLLSGAYDDDDDTYDDDARNIPSWNMDKEQYRSNLQRESMVYDFDDDINQSREYRNDERRSQQQENLLKHNLQERQQRQQDQHRDDIRRSQQQSSQQQQQQQQQPYRAPEGKSTRTLLYRLLCPNARAGSVIGKNGEKVKQLQRDSGAKIKVEPPVDSTIPERVISIEAYDVEDSQVWAPSQIALLRIVETIVLDGQRNYTIGGAEESNGNIVIRLLLPSSQIRNVIGRFGNVIERIRVGSGSLVRVLPSSETPRCAKRNDEVLQISADSMDNIASALAMITTQLRLDPPVRAHELPGGTKVHNDRASSEASRRINSGIVNEGGVLTSVTTPTTKEQQQQSNYPLGFNEYASSYYGEEKTSPSSDTTDTGGTSYHQQPQSPQTPLAYSQNNDNNVPDTTDVCGLFNITNFEGLDDTEPEARIAPGDIILFFHRYLLFARVLF